MKFKGLPNSKTHKWWRVFTRMQHQFLYHKIHKMLQLLILSTALWRKFDFPKIHSYDEIWTRTSGCHASVLFHYAIENDGGWGGIIVEMEFWGEEKEDQT